MDRKQCVQSCAELISANCVKCGRHSIGCDRNTFHFYLLVAKTASSAPLSHKNVGLHKYTNRRMIHLQSRVPHCSVPVLRTSNARLPAPSHCCFTYWGLLWAPVTKHIVSTDTDRHTASLRGHIWHAITHTHTLMYSRLVSLPPLYTHTH